MTDEPVKRVASPTPSEKRLGALQRMKQLGAKLKPKSKKAGEAIVEEVVIEEAILQPQFIVDEVVMPDPLDPTALAHRLRSLITQMPKPSETPPPIRSTPPAVDADGRPIAPRGSVLIKDPKLLELLHDADFMNGDAQDGRAGVWAALEALDAPKPTAGEDTEPVHPTDVMFTFPTHPTDESEVLLAQSHIVEVPISKLETFWQSRWSFLWSMTVGLVATPKAPQTKQVKVWVPSTTKISFQAMWWGYRIYLPAPVMAILNSNEAEAVKIAGTLTAALTWFLSNISPSAVPPPLLPAFFLIQKIGPYVGYISTFIAWIWSTINGRDKGYGVVLTATWLLPVALIPSSIKPPPVGTPGTINQPPPSTTPATT